MLIQVGKAVLIFAVPLAIAWAGGLLMAKLSGRQAPSGYGCREVDAKVPLNLRLCGYSAEDAGAHWRQLKDGQLDAERRFLEIDLVYPFLYGGAILAGLLLGRAWLGSPFEALWLVLPVALTAVADWVENLVQLGQLQRFRAAGAEAIDGGWIQLASIATVVKIWTLLALIAALALTALAVALRPVEG